MSAASRQSPGPKRHRAGQAGARQEGSPKSKPSAPHSKSGHKPKRPVGRSRRRSWRPLCAGRGNSSGERCRPVALEIFWRALTFVNPGTRGVSYPRSGRLRGNLRCSTPRPPRYCAVLDDACQGVSRYETGTRTQVAAKIIAARRGGTTADSLKRVGRKGRSARRPRCGGEKPRNDRRPSRTAAFRPR